MNDEIIGEIDTLREKHDGELDRIPPEVAQRLGHYVYAYFDPRSKLNIPFYVGKGHGNRALEHLTASGESRKVCVLNELQALGLRPRIEILAHQLPDGETALRIEAAVIDLLGLGVLTNQVRGWRSVQLGRVPLDELIGYYGAKPVEVNDPVLLIRINKLYRHGMSDDELYDVTRGVWKLGPRRTHAKYAFAVFQGVVREVYEIRGWYPAWTTPYKYQRKVDAPGRWEFVGFKAQEPVRSLYRLRSVAHYFRPGQRSPVVYVDI